MVISLNVLEQIRYIFFAILTKAQEKSTAIIRCSGIGYWEMFFLTFPGVQETVTSVLIRCSTTVPYIQLLNRCQYPKVSGRATSTKFNHGIILSKPDAGRMGDAEAQCRNSKVACDDKVVQQGSVWKQLCPGLQAAQRKPFRPP